MNVVKQMREKARVTQTELARKAGTSQSAIAAYESGSKSPTLRTLDRLANALSLSVHMEVSPALTREDQRSLAFHKAVAEKLMRDPEGTIEHARKNLSKLKRIHPHARNLLERWDTWLKLPPAELADRMVEHDEVARDMRQVSPFSGVLSAAERTRILRQFRENYAA